MGYPIAQHMDTNSMKKAYEMAIRQRIHPNRQLIHHSDRGLQCCSAEYVKLSKGINAKISMTEKVPPMKMPWLKE